MRIVFWGSSDFSMPSLESLIKNHEVAGVVTNPDRKYGRGLKKTAVTPVKRRAEELGIPVLQPEKLKAPLFFESFQKLEPEISVVVSYGRIIPEKFLNYPRYRSVNLHASILPKYRGASPIHAALLNGDQETGNTVQYMNARLDSGNIIMTEKEKILPEDDYLTLSQRLSVQGARLLLESLSKIEAGKVSEIEQDEDKAVYCHVIHKDEGRVSFRTMTAEEIFRKRKAYIAWPGIHTVYQHKTKVILIEIEPVCMTHPDAGIQDAGKIIYAEKKNGLTVKCKKGMIRIRKLKPVGKKEMDDLSFINGYKPESGGYFEGDIE